jgi:type IV pilus assembly protein PilB
VVVAFNKKKHRDESAPNKVSFGNAPGSVTTVVGDSGGDDTDKGVVGTDPLAAGLAASSSPVVPSERQVRLGEQLIGGNLITEDQLQQALAMQRESGGRLGEVLVSLGAMNEQALAHALAAFFGFEVANLRRDVVDSMVLTFVTEEVAREHMAFPVRLDEEALYIAVAEPSDELRDLLSKASGKPVRLLIAPLGDIRWAIDSNYRALGTVDKLVQAFESVEGTRRRSTESVESEIVADDAPVVQVVDRILTQAMRDRASDVHIEPSEDIVRVRFRIDGALKEILQLPAAIGPGLVSRIKIMANMNIVERRRPQDGQLTITIDGKEVDVRVATVATIMGESCVMRLLDKTRSVLQDRPGPVRHGALRRADRQRQDNDALRHAQRGE